MITKTDTEAIADAISTAIRVATKPLLDRVKALETRTAELEKKA